MTQSTCEITEDWAFAKFHFYVNSVWWEWEGRVKINFESTWNCQNKNIGAMKTKEWLGKSW